MALPIMAAIPLIGTVLDKAIDLFQGDDKRQAELLREQIQNSHLQVMGQLDVNKNEALHGSVFVAGWRPAVGWVCALSILNDFLVRPYVQAFYPEINLPSVSGHLMELVMGMLGIAGLRSFEKLKGVAK